MSKHTIIILSLCVVVMCGCGKTIAEEADDKQENTETPVPGTDKDDNGNGDDNGGDNGEGTEPADSTNTDDNETEGISYITVRQAQELTENQEAWVKGYIVGVCKGGLGNTDFETPFNETAAIVLADVPTTADTIPANYQETLFPVQVDDYKLVYDNLHLSQRPEMHNKQVMIFGLCTSYMRRMGMKKVTDFIIIE